MITEKYNFIEIYLCKLNGDLKSKLNEYNINDYLFPSNTLLFNYPSFLKYLCTWRITSSIERWTKNIIRTLKLENKYVLQDLDLVIKFKKLIHMSLIKIFIENGANLHTLDIEVSYYCDYDSYLDGVLELMLQNPNFFCNIRNLKLYFIDSSLSRIKSHISQIINLHRNLKKIVLGYDSFPLYQSLSLSEDYNYSNTLNTIILYYVSFKGINNLDKVFEQLNGLESVHIIYCCLNTSFIQQIINLTKPFKLKTLFLNGSSQISKLLQLLLQKYGVYLENFGFGFCRDLLFKQQLLESITRYCKNVKFLDLNIFENKNIHLVFNLIEKLNQNLYHLSINVGQIDSSSDHIESSSIILRNLGQLLPLQLDYLSLTLNINTKDFEIFLENSQNTFINKLLINNRGGHGILSCIKECVKKKQRIKNLAIIENSLEVGYENKDLFTLKDEVKKFESYDIRVQRYNNLVVCTNYDINFTRELD
ncbi:hypothetical protein GLOIN_2v1763297 [Rhizophagus clarus]|nr:hypothetical protein GLOIN_2v1763297 [Rhizophagus clarus]